MTEMYVEYRDGNPVAYRYGEEWVAMQLFMEGGYPTPEEAIAAWERDNGSGGNGVINMHKKRINTQNHTVTYNGKTQSISKWAKEYGLSYFTLYRRLQRGWDIERALFTGSNVKMS